MTSEEKKEFMELKTEVMMIKGMVDTLSKGQSGHDVAINRVLQTLNNGLVKEMKRVVDSQRILTEKIEQISVNCAYERGNSDRDKKHYSERWRDLSIGKKIGFAAPLAIIIFRPELWQLATLLWNAVMTWIAGMQG